MSTILSIYAGKHDAAICVLQNGKVLINYEKERYTRVKEDGGFCKDFLFYVLEKVNLSIEDIDILVLDFKTSPLNLYKNIVSSVTGIPFPNGHGYKELFSKSFHQGKGNFFGKNLTIFSIHHHLAHSAGAYFTSPFLNASILTADGGGWAKNFSFATAQNGVLKFHDSIWTNPLGKLWDILPKFYGISKPGSLMAIGGYGNKDLEIHKRLFDILTKNPSSKLSDFKFTINDVSFDKGEINKHLNPKNHNDSDLAHSLQVLTDGIFTNWFAKALDHGFDNICFAGGLALNCISNSRAAINSGTKNIHVPPNPNDAGLAMGAALAVHFYILKNKYDPSFFSPYNGASYKNSDCIKAVEFLKQKYSKIKIYKATNERIVNILLKDNVVARFFDKSESGPRALGHRSFIAKPDIRNIRKKMNRVKKREWYRPFAPMILSEKANDLFENSVKNSYYMNTSSVVKKKWRQKLSGVLHVDNTTRPQFVDNFTCSDTYDLLKKFNIKSQIPALMNTSFNVQEPLVETPLDAAKTFLKIKNDVKHLQINDYLIEKTL